MTRAQLRIALGGAAAALALGGASCGGGGGDDEGRDARLDATVERLQDAFDRGDLEGICAMMSTAGQRQVVTAGHKSAPSCEAGLRPFVRAVERRRRAGQPRPAVRSAVIRATVTLSVGARSTANVTFVERDGAWKLNSLFGTSPEKSQTID